MRQGKKQFYLNMGIQFHKKTILFVFTNLLGKSLAAFAQLYAITVFTRTQTQGDAAIIFLLMGYAVWFQIFEFGFSQALQNKFNSRSMSAQSVVKVFLFHYSFLMVVAILVIVNPFFPEILLSTVRAKSNPSGAQAFSIGAAILILASSNNVLQRFLLIINKGRFGNSLIILQSLLVIVSLLIYQLYDQTSPILAVGIYLGPQIFVSIPLLVGFVSRLLRIKKTKPIRGKLLISLFGFMGTNVLSAIFLGSDYYFAAHYLSSAEIVSYFLVTRIFFVSYIVYFAFLQFRARKLWSANLMVGNRELSRIIRESCLVGLVAVFLTYLAASYFEYIGIFKLMTHGFGVGKLLLFLGFIYFIIRVFRDVGLVLVGNLDAKRLLYQIYLIEVALSLVMMYVAAPVYGASGILISLILASLMGFLFLIWRLRFFYINSKAILR
jgi:O-antigen/teichoic acid export membrane protein